MRDSSGEASVQAARNGWHDADRVAVFNDCVFLLQVTDIFVVHIDVHEAADAPVVGVQVFAQVPVCGRQPLQRLPYLFVIFVLFPMVIWTGLAMSPAIASVFPSAVTVLGGQQSARTIHFFISVFLFLFLLVHIMMICLAGFRNRMRAMITGRAAAGKERL